MATHLFFLSLSFPPLSLSFFRSLSLSLSVSLSVIVSYKSTNFENPAVMAQLVKFSIFEHLKLQLSLILGNGCSTAVERTPQNREVVGLNPTGCWAFFLFSILSVVSP